jgi:hypothetical protein
MVVVTQKNMSPAKKKAAAKSQVKFKDLHSKKNPKGGVGGLKKDMLNPQPLPP